MLVFGYEPCEKSANLKWREEWYCAEHYDYMVKANSGVAW